jgi:hypothetical protein
VRGARGARETGLARASVDAEVVVLLVVHRSRAELATSLGARFELLRDLPLVGDLDEAGERGGFRLLGLGHVAAAARTRVR